MASFRPFVFVLGFRLFVLSDSLFLSRDLLRDLSLLAVFSIPIRFAGLIKHSFLIPQIHISIASIIPSMLTSHHFLGSLGFSGSANLSRDLFLDFEEDRLLLLLLDGFDRSNCDDFS